MKIRHLLLIATLVAIAPGALAQGQLNFQNIAQVEVTSQDATTGEVTTELQDANLVKPGEVVLFTSIFTNISDEVAENITVNNPVPDNMEYVSFSARGEGAAVNYSVDGENFGSPDSLLVVGEDGVERAARPEEYKEIQWVFESELAPGESGEVSFKARLL